MACRGVGGDGVPVHVVWVEFRQRVLLLFLRALDQVLHHPSSLLLRYIDSILTDDSIPFRLRQGVPGDPERARVDDHMHNVSGIA